MQNAPLTFLYIAGILNYSGHSGLSAVDSEQSGFELGGSACAWTDCSLTLQHHALHSRLSVQTGTARAEGRLGNSSV